MDLDNSFQEPDVSLNDILKAVKEQGDINSRLRQDLSQLRQEVQGSTLSVATQVKKFKTESDYKWKYEGNRVQFSLNSELLEDLNHTSWALDYSKTDYAREKIGEIKDKIAKRNKLIKIAGTSEGGWEVVRQYQTNPIASDTDDETRINKAENMAICKRKFKGKKTNKTYTTSTSCANAFQFQPDLPANLQPPFREPQSWFTGFPLYNNQFKQFSTGGNQRKGNQGGFFSCGSMQHWRNRCPFNPKADPKPKTD
jgi:hypothetical protein